MRTNFSNALAMLAINVEEMILAQSAALAETVGRMAESILAVRARLRPGRSFRAAHENRSESGAESDSRPRKHGLIRKRGEMAPNNHAALRK